MRERAVRRGDDLGLCGLQCLRYLYAQHITLHPNDPFNDWFETLKR
jgi:hypothetical protein